MVGIALHIGLDGVDPDAYEGWDGSLSACENDATALQKITHKLGYKTKTLLTKRATTQAALSEIGRAANALSAGDIFVLTYAGHGGQLTDHESDESDQRDETWVMYDRQLLDDELWGAFCAFKAGVRIVTISDSCHSGTVVREGAEHLLQHHDIVHAFAQVTAPRAGGTGSPKPPSPGPLRIREIPSDVQQRVEARYAALYRGIRQGTPRQAEAGVKASVILLAACQDNQTSAEQNGHGLFTSTLLNQWNGMTFSGNYPAVMSAARRQLPAVQSPNMLTAGQDWPSFENQIALAVTPPTDTPAIGSNQQQNDTSVTDPSKKAEPMTDPQLTVSVGVRLRPVDQASELLLNLLSASLEAPNTDGKRGLATLFLETLSCQKPDDYGGDEPIITFNGERVWSASGMDSGDSRAVGYQRAFSDFVAIKLYDEEVGVDDEIGSRVISSDEAGLGTRTAYFAGEGGARYSLTYSVE